MVNKIEELNLTEKIEKEMVLETFKEISDVNIQDIMAAHPFLVEEGKNVQGNYREYLKAYVRGFILRAKEIKNNKCKFKGIISKYELKEALELLNEQKKLIIKICSHESGFFKVHKIVSIYTTFVLDGPIHVVETLFPGGFKVKYENGVYLCPVKENQKDNPGAVCGFCIAEQMNMCSNN